MNHIILGAAYGTADVTTTVQNLVGKRVIDAGLLDELLLISMPSTLSGAAEAAARARSLDARLRTLPLPVTADNATFGDSWPGVRKSLVVVYEYEGQPRLEIVQEGMTMNLRGSLPLEKRTHHRKGELRILGAAYGLGDVTDRARSLVRDHSLDVMADNTTWGDTWYGTRKTLVVVYHDGEESHVAISAEGSRLAIRA